MFISNLPYGGETPNGLRHRPRAERVGYLRWGGDGEAVQPEKG